MKILFTRLFLDSDISYIKSRLRNNIELIIPSDYSEESLVKNVKDVDVLFGGFISEELIKSATNLKFVQIPWTGVDNLNFELLKKYNVTVCNSHSNSLAVAEHAIALMFDAAKKISYHDRLLRIGEWNRVNRNSKNELSPSSRIINYSNVGIIGFGAIGQKLYQFLSGFSCSFKIFTKSIHSASEFLKDIEFFTTNELPNCLPFLDYIFIAVPLTSETTGLFNKHFFDLMKPVSILINVSRGETIIEKDLFNALKHKDIGFAAIDTWYNYPTKENPVTFPSKKYKFHLLNNIVLSSHRAGYAEGILPHLDDAIENLNRLSNRDSLINIISLEKEY